jgi:hypothetical protein
MDREEPLSLFYQLAYRIGFAPWERATALPRPLRNAEPRCYRLARG